MHACTFCISNYLSNPKISFQSSFFFFFYFSMSFYLINYFLKSEIFFQDLWKHTYLVLLLHQLSWLYLVPFLILTSTCLLSTYISWMNLPNPISFNGKNMLLTYKFLFLIFSSPLKSKLIYPIDHIWLVLGYPFKHLEFQM